MRGLCLLAFLIAVFPANVFAAFNHVEMGGHEAGPAYLLVRAPFQLALMKHSVHQMQEMQGFTAHILASYSDRMVRAANDVAVSEQPEEGGRRRYLSVERARANQAAGDGS